MQDANDDWEVTRPSRSTGLIRGAIFGAIFLLAIIGLVALVTKLLQTNTTASNPQIVEITTEESSKNFKRLTTEWTQAKDALKNAVGAEKSFARNLSETRAQSTAQEAILKAQFTKRMHGL